MEQVFFYHLVQFGSRPTGGSDVVIVVETLTTLEDNVFSWATMRTVLTNNEEQASQTLCVM